MHIDQQPKIEDWGDKFNNVDGSKCLDAYFVFR